MYCWSLKYWSGQNQSSQTGSSGLDTHTHTTTQPSLQVHYAELKRKQERLIQDMEKAVYRRETIILKGEAQTKAGKVENTKGHLRKKIEEARKKLKQTTDSIAFCSREAKALQTSQGDLSGQLEESQQACHQLQTTAEALEEEAEQLSETKQLVCMCIYVRTYVCTCVCTCLCVVGWWSMPFSHVS